MCVFRSLSALSVSLMLCAACQGHGSDDSEQTQLPQIKVNLPPPPTFQKEHAPEKYADGTVSIHGLRKELRKNLNQSVRVKAYLLEAYQCPECPRELKRKKQCPLCKKPHLWLSDRATGPKDKALMVTGYPKRDPKTRRKLTFNPGQQYVFSGVFSKSSGTGFSDSDGLLIYEDSAAVIIQ